MQANAYYQQGYPDLTAQIAHQQSLLSNPMLQIMNRVSVNNLPVNMGQIQPVMTTANVLIPTIQPYLHQNLMSNYATTLLSQPSGSSPITFDGSPLMNIQDSLKIDSSNCYNVFVGDISQDVDNNVLNNAFRKFGQIAEAKVIRDPQSMKSRGYGFVSFWKQDDAQKAIDEMNGEVLGKRAIRTNWATRKNNESKRTTTYEEVLSACDGENTSVYLGNIGPDVTEADIRASFSAFGTVKQVRMFSPKNYGFVVFDTKENAAKAIHEFSGQEIRGHTITCSWGKLSDQPPKINPLLMLANMNKMVSSQLTGLPLLPTQLYSTPIMPSWQ